jgi:serine kinase of HPr protein (carbohydrate metabolism regulator)
MDVANIHASCVMLAKAAPFPAGHSGVLILGESGAGKSDLALRLIEQGSLLVSDDRTELFVESGKLTARAPATLAGLIELRGVGILTLSYEKTAAIALVVQLGAANTVPRLPERARYAPPPPLALPEAAWPPLIRLHAFEASAVAKVRWAALAFQQGLFRGEADQ